jgi:hypothetical protein
MARVREVIFFSMFLGSIWKVAGSISANTGMAPVINIACAEAINVYGVRISSSPPPIFAWIRAAIKAFVPFTTDKHLLDPIICAHFCSNSTTALARDHTPLLKVFSTLSSSVEGFQIGHRGQPPVWTGTPPSRAGTSALRVLKAYKGNPAEEANRTPIPVNEFFLINSRLEKDFVYMYCYLNY